MLPSRIWLFSSLKQTSLLDKISSCSSLFKMSINGLFLMGTSINYAFKNSANCNSLVFKAANSRLPANVEFLEMPLIIAINKHTPYGWSDQVVGLFQCWLGVTINTLGFLNKIYVFWRMCGLPEKFIYTVGSTVWVAVFMNINSFYFLNDFPVSIAL